MSTPSAPSLCKVPNGLWRVWSSPVSLPNSGLDSARCRSCGRSPHFRPSLLFWNRPQCSEPLWKGPFDRNPTDLEVRRETGPDYKRPRYFPTESGRTESGRHRTKSGTRETSCLRCLRWPNSGRTLVLGKLYVCEVCKRIDKSQNWLFSFY